MAYLMESDGTGGVSALNVYWVFVSPNGTSAEVQAYIQNTSTPVSYGYDLVLSSSSFSGSFQAATITSSTSEYVKFNLTSLTAGATYKIKVRAFSGAGAIGSYGLSTYTEFTMPASSSVASILQTSGMGGVNRGEYGSTLFEGPDPYVTNPVSINNTYTHDDSHQATGTYPVYIPGSDNDLSNTTLNDKPIERTTKSLFKLSRLDETKKDWYSVAYKSYSQLTTGGQYYAFGGSLFFTPTTTSIKQAGGIAFFVDNDGATGYFIKINTTNSAAVNNVNEISIYKIKNGRLYLVPGQSLITKSLKGVYAGKIYKIDIRVKVNASSVEIYAYINGLEVTAIDSNPSGPASSEDPTPILATTNKVGMICTEGTIYFDYIYGMRITEEQYNQEKSFNIYEGQYSEALVSFLYGNKTLENNSISNSVTNGFIEEFGCVARELRNVKINWERPAFPKYSSTGVNNFAKIISQRLTSFKGDIYVINNSGTYIPLDDSRFYSFFVIGNQVSPSGTLEYVDDSASEYSVAEPVVFESEWLQKQSDVANLGSWIKNIWASKQKIVNLQIFANPLLSIGDIVTITYPYNGLTSSDKFVITNITQQFREGLQTTITARTL